jgi:hypothetical protein
VPLGCYPIVLVINRDYRTATWTKSESNALVENESPIAFEEFAEDSQPSQNSQQKAARGLSLNGGNKLNQVISFWICQVTSGWRALIWSDF